MKELTRFERRWGELNGLSATNVDFLLSKADDAASKQTRYHNFVCKFTEVEADKAINEFERYAVSLGFEVYWPGLYPILKKNGYDIHLPERD